MMSRKTLNQTIPNWMNNGIFANLSSLNVPWKNDVSGKVLDMKYHGNHSGMKKISPLLEALSNDDVIDNQNLTDIANILFEIYNKPWTKLYATMSLEYNPIENYRMVETEVVNGTNTGTVETDNNVTYGKQNDVNETSANTGTVETDNNVTYGKQNAVDETSANTGTVETDNNVTYGKQNAVDETSDNTGTVSDNTTLTKNTVQTTTNNLTDTLNNTVEELPEEVITKNSSNSNTSQDSVFGFDSVDAVNTDKTVDNGSVEDTETHSGKNTTTTEQSATKTGTVEISDTGTDTTASTRTDDLHSTKSYTDKSSGTDTTKETRTDDLHSTKSYTDKSSGTDTTKETRTDDLHYTKSYTDSSSGTDTSKEKRTDDLENHTDRTLTRSGNIGVTTSQQMIESERQLWLWKYFDIIFKDVDSLLTIDIY